MKQKFYKKSKELGWTLWELLLSLLILGCFLSLALPTMHTVLITHQAHNRVQTMMSVLNRARREAFQLHTTISVLPNPTWVQGLKILQGTHSLQKITFPITATQIRVQWTGLGPHDRIQFDAAGHAYGTNGHFDVCTESRCWKIIINPAGRIRSE